jgi:hypothetical protein
VIAARRRLAHVVMATIPLTELIILAALLAFPGATNGRVLPAAGVAALVASVALVAVHLDREARRGDPVDRRLARAAARGVAAATLVAWIPVLGALALVAI